MRQPPENSVSGRVELVGAEAEAAQDGPGLRLQPVAAERLEAVLQVAVALGERLARRVVSSARATSSISRSSAHTSSKPLERLRRARSRSALPATSWGR